LSRKNKNLKIQHPAQNSLTITKSQLYAGPLPSPDLLKKFDEIVPGSADRLITQFEEQSKHRRTLEQKVIGNDICLSRIGIIFGFLIGMTAIIGGLLISLQGKELSGGMISGSGIIGLVSVFVYGSRSKRKYLEKREN